MTSSKYNRINTAVKFQHWHQIDFELLINQKLQFSVVSQSKWLQVGFKRPVWFALWMVKWSKPKIPLVDIMNNSSPRQRLDP